MLLLSPPRIGGIIDQSWCIDQGLDESGGLSRLAGLYSVCFCPATHLRSCPFLALGKGCARSGMQKEWRSARTNVADSHIL